MAKAKTKCVAPGCKETKILARGLCERCYFSARRLINRKVYRDWTEIEQAGLCNPTGTPLYSAAMKLKQKKGAAK